MTDLELHMWARAARRVNVGDDHSFYAMILDAEQHARGEPMQALADRAMLERMITEDRRVPRGEG